MTIPLITCLNCCNRSNFPQIFLSFLHKISQNFVSPNFHLALSPLIALISLSLSTYLHRRTKPNHHRPPLPPSPPSSPSTATTALLDTWTSFGHLDLDTSMLLLNTWILLLKYDISWTLGLLLDTWMLLLNTWTIGIIKITLLGHLASL